MKAICTNCNHEQVINVRHTPVRIARCEECGKTNLARIRPQVVNVKEKHPWRVNND